MQTFGHFEVFVDGRPLNLPRAKSKECLAYLIDRKGARLTVAEIASVLWEDKENDINTQNNAHQVIFTLMKALKDAGIEDIVIKSRREIAIDVSKVDCDYYAAIDHLEETTAYYRKQLTDNGFDIIPGTHPCVPVMLYDEKLAGELISYGIIRKLSETTDTAYWSSG